MITKEILLITNYFPPEKGAASNRIFSMAKEFSENNYKVTVVCPLPNYPQGKIFKNFRKTLFLKKEESYATVYRLWLWPSNSSNKFIRMISMISFSISLSFFLLFRKTPKKVIVQYSPVFVGFTSVFWLQLFKKKVILNVSDLWPLAGLEMGILKKGFYYSVLTKMEQFCYKNSNLILGQSNEILTHIKKTNPHKALFLYRNYPEFTPPSLSNSATGKTRIKIVYAGLLGVAQGLFEICSEINFSEQVSFHIYGAGPETQKIKNLHKEYIYYHGEIERERLHQKLQNYDIGFVPLANRIYGSVPSKIFELSRLGLPVLYFAGGEGEDIVTNNKIGWVIPVDNVTLLQNFINTLTSEKLMNFPKKEVQENAIKKFDFKQQFNLLEKEVNLT